MAWGEVRRERMVFSNEWGAGWAAHFSMFLGGTQARIEIITHPETDDTWDLTDR